MVVDIPYRYGGLLVEHPALFFAAFVATVLEAVEVECWGEDDGVVICYLRDVSFHIVGFVKQDVMQGKLGEESRKDVPAAKSESIGGPEPIHKTPNLKSMSPALNRPNSFRRCKSSNKPPTILVP
jgi:hypothetical protein